MTSTSEHHPDVDLWASGHTAWRAEFDALRLILLGAGLDEKIKWRKPCFTCDGVNIAIFQPFKAMCALMFFKGAMLDDPDGHLREQGEHSRSAKRLEFTAVDDIVAMRGVIEHLVADAIAAAAEGREPPPHPADGVIYPAELIAALEADGALRDAFERLTPGRQRGYVLHIGGAKQSATRASRVEKVTPRILDGLGIDD